MFPLIDTHAHLYSSKFDEDRAAMLDRAEKAGVKRIYLPNIDSRSIESMMALVAERPLLCVPMMGVHPCSINADYKQELDLAAEWLAKYSYAGVGEIGIDLYWDKTFLAEQQDAFATQCQWAMELDLPVSIHAREANEECLEIVEKLQDGRLSGVFHCFSGTVAQAERMIAAGFYLGIGGVVTNPKAGLDVILPQLPLDRMVLETDAPFLAPAPYRGKRNESAYLLPIAARMADLLQVSLEEVANVTTRNAETVFSKRSKPVVL